MTYVIHRATSLPTSLPQRDCIQCVSVSNPQLPRCASQCPTGAIQSNGTTYQIDRNLCNNCVGYSLPQCAAICPTGACIPAPSDYWQRWFVKYNHLRSHVQDDASATYWETWFDHYSQTLSKLTHSHPPQSVGVAP